MNFCSEIFKTISVFVFLFLTISWKLSLSFICTLKSSPVYIPFCAVAWKNAILMNCDLISGIITDIFSEINFTGKRTKYTELR